MDCISWVELAWGLDIVIRGFFVDASRAVLLGGGVHRPVWYMTINILRLLFVWGVVILLSLASRLAAGRSMKEGEVGFCSCAQKGDCRD